MDKTWMPTTAGILNIICGAWDILTGIFAIVFGAASGWLMSFLQTMISSDISAAVLTMLSAILYAAGVIYLIFGIFVVIGGIYTLRRQIWGMALASSIISILIIWPFGIASTVFVSLSHGEFK